MDELRQAQRAMLNENMGSIVRDIDNITDIHIKTVQNSGTDHQNLELDPENSLIFPGPTYAGLENQKLLAGLLSCCKQVDRDDFMVRYQDNFYRGRRDTRAVDGIWFRMRKLAKTPPDLDNLPSPMPPQIIAALLSRALCKGGLIYVTGGPGSGKTTTASAVVVSRLKTFGGVAYTVEDPPEMPLNGRHGSGYCTQTTVAGDRTSDWTESLRGVLRSQPVGTYLTLFIGEVRDKETAQTMLRAASNGFLVICTSFGSDLISSIDSFYQMLGSEYTNTLSATIRMILYQRLHDGKFTPEMLISEGPSSRVATIIRHGNITQLKDEIMYQRNAVLASQPNFNSTR
jgi:Tfp pilus assembly pilus retraction ATPase PilT